MSPTMDEPATVERVIVFPLFDNEHKPLRKEVKSILSEVVDISGAYSLVKQTGVWKDKSTGIVYNGTLEYRVFVTSETEEEDAILYSHLPEWTSRLRQVCLYTSTAHISKELVYSTQPLAA